MTPNQFGELTRLLFRLFIGFSGLYFMIRSCMYDDPLLYCAGLGGLWLQSRFAE